ncbi:MAG: hypothetical protein KGQ49_06475, partial [Verrucomicrobia bacterium]|nr:hypothetical protein [Verrucomicrobiota bacterium]
EAIQLLVKYDTKKIWKSYLGDWLRQSFEIMDLESIANLYPLSKECDERGNIQSNHAWQKISAFWNSGTRFTTDPFLSDTPIRALDVPIQGSHLFEYSKNDNALIREYKRQIQEMIWGPLIP